MSDLCGLIWRAFIGLFRPRAALEAEILVLRHQLNVLRRKSPKRLAFRNINRLVFAPHPRCRNDASGIADIPGPGKQVRSARQISDGDTSIPRGLAAVRTDIAPAIATSATQADALFVVGEPLTFTHRLRISTLALAARLHTTYPTRGYVEVGGLMSYGPNFPASFRRAADYFHKILLARSPVICPSSSPLGTISSLI
jgi:hypothetical protein